MSIKTRLLFSYLAMTFIPIVLFAAIAATLVTSFYKDIAGTGDGKRIPAFWELANQRQDLIAGVKFMTETAPDHFMDNEFLKDTDLQLNRLYTGLVVMKNKQVLFTSPLLNQLDLEQPLQELETNQHQDQWGKKIDGHLSLETYDVTFKDGTTGTVYLLSDMEPIFKEVRKFFPLLLLSLLVVIGLTNGLLTFFVSRSFIQPLITLKHGAEQMKEGNLDYEVNLNRKDEIGQVGAAFEDMRIRLKESIQLQIKYEENRKELMSNISHDLKTPITGIKACVQGIQDGIADTGPKRAKYMNMIAKKAEDMDLLIDELMLYSKLDLKRLPFHLETMDLNAYLRDCVEELQLDPRMETIKITFPILSNQPVLVMADRDKLHRVILNIFDNSVKYMDKPDKEIRLELMDGLDVAIVSIHDNGPGIDSAALSHIFDRFYRADPSRNSETGGTGLGLAIAKQIIEGQGGRVWAESQIGEGTSMYFTLPKSKLESEYE
ncbi:sensor histidine kinase [Neobacillus jeddahensis]|uniref:sensor histidine kinase n=1 Tax=Neobacillus jeddahensis TaxID=1461580 RepID=UPI00058DE01D|nr:HAMP domain-containing sensor histidine kinase [Neobacillus jeddahensis]